VTATLTITDTTMTSDHSAHTARQASGREYGWEVSWLPGQVLDRSGAVTAMVLADTAARTDLHDGHRLWPHIQGWAAELGLTGPDAITMTAQPPGGISHDHQPATRRPDPKAANRPARPGMTSGTLRFGADPGPDPEAEP
jgi:hypothetical protein